MAKQTAKKIAAKDADQYMLRLPPGMREAVAKLAESNGRSMNTEIVAAIEQHLRGPSRFDALEAFIEDHRDNIAALNELYEKVEKIEGMVYDHDERFNPMKYDRD